MKRECITEGCNKESAPGTRYCWSCKRWRWAKKYPSKYVYGYLKQNAKRRSIEFSLTLDEFDEFCEKTHYLFLKGQTRDSLTIDRKDSRKGYERGNIQVLTLSENSSKGCQIPKEFMPREDCPF